MIHIISGISIGFLLAYTASHPHIGGFLECLKAGSIAVVLHLVVLALCGELLLSDLLSMFDYLNVAKIKSYITREILNG